MLGTPYRQSATMEHERTSMTTHRLPHALAALGLSLMLTLSAASPALAQGSARARCIAEVARAGLIGPDVNPSNANFVGGTDGHDVFTPTAGRDVFCGFGGVDGLEFPIPLGEGDIFFGGRTTTRRTSMVASLLAGQATTSFSTLSRAPSSAEMATIS
jgi:hypothetical protein